MNSRAGRDGPPDPGSLMARGKTRGVLVGLDVGTSAVRALAVDAGGTVMAVAAAAYPLSTPRPGWAEQDPEDWWQAARKALRELTEGLKAPVLGVGLTGQMHGAVFLDERDRVIRPALLWNDQRTARQTRSITEIVGEDRLLEIAANPALTGFQAPKILWLRDEEPAAYARVNHVLLPKDFIRLRLTGEYATDASDASGTLLLDVRRRRWSDELLAALDIRARWLPQVYESPDTSGQVSAEAAFESGLPPGIPVAAGAGDNAAAAVGLGIVGDGVASVSIGTSGVVFVDVGSRIPIGGPIHTFCHAVPGRYHMMGVTLAAGGSLRWWRDAFFSHRDFDALTASAATIPPGAEGLLYFPYLSGERTPHRDPLARGGFLGLTTRHTSAHMTRAVMEGVAFSLKDCLDLIVDAGVKVHDLRATGGGARSELWRQIVADVLGMPIYRPQMDEGPAYGAALLGGVAAGLYDTVAEAVGNIRLLDAVEKPDFNRTRLYSNYHSAYADFYPLAAPLMHRLAHLAGDSAELLSDRDRELTREFSNE